MNNKQKIPTIAGFTLIELMMVVAILSILMAIALPAYNDHVRKARRIDAMAELMELSATQEKNYAQSSVFVASETISAEGYYTIKAVITATSYTLTATPISTTDQANDTDCAVLSYTNLGVRTASGTLGTACW